MLVVVTGVSPDRELPMVKAIFFGLPLEQCFIALSASWFLMALYPPLIKVILVIGGLYLCYEGVHKAVEKAISQKRCHQSQAEKLYLRQKRSKVAIRTDLILSIEIIVIAKGTLSGDYLTQVLSLVCSWDSQLL
jgi:predicted DNA repair protein MutK